VRARAAFWSLAGPSAFALAATIGSRLERDYRSRDEPISALATEGSPAARVMVPGFLGLAIGTIKLAYELRESDVAPGPIPALLSLAGVTVAGAGLARCSDRRCPTRALGDENVTRSDDLHAAFSGATFALWIAVPCVAAGRARQAGSGYRFLSGVINAATLAALVGGGLRARNGDDSWSGAAQRVMVGAALSWYPLAAFTAGGRNAASRSRRRTLRRH
jgi:hypothetical protein